MLGRVAGVIELIHDPGGEADLVAIGRITRRGGRHQLTLGELAGDGLGDRGQGIGRAGQTHRTVDIGAPGQRVADRAADAGGRTAKGLDLGGVVVRLVFEQQQPGFPDAVGPNFDFHRAGVDLLALVEPVELSGGAEGLDRQRGQIHQTDGLGALERGTGVEIILPGFLQQRVLKGYAVDDRVERGVAAVVGPVGVQHTQLGEGGIALF